MHGPAAARRNPCGIPVAGAVDLVGAVVGAPGGHHGVDVLEGGRSRAGDEPGGGLVSFGRAVKGILLSGNYVWLAYAGPVEAGVQHGSAQPGAVRRYGMGLYSLFSHRNAHRIEQ